MARHTVRAQYELVSFLQPEGRSLSPSLRQAALSLIQNRVRDNGENLLHPYPFLGRLFSSVQSHQSTLSACCVQGFFPQGSRRKCQTPSLPGLSMSPTSRTGTKAHISIKQGRHLTLWNLPHYL